MRNFKMALLAATVVAGFASHPAHAGLFNAGETATLTDNEVHGDILNITIPGTTSVVEAYVGQNTLTTTSGTFFAWCIDIFHDINLGGGQALPYVMDTTASTSLTSDMVRIISGLIHSGNEYTNSDDLAATQLAIWTVEYGPIAYTGGNAQVAATLDRELYATTDPNYGTDLMPMRVIRSTDGHQTFASVPEPASLAVLGMGLLGMVGVSRRRRTA